MSIDANDLLLFARVVDAGSFSRAAELMHLQKSTVSRRIAELENQVGERLLHRTTRKLVLTDFGISLLIHARQVGLEVEAADAVILHRQSVPSGRLRVSAPRDFTCAFFANSIPAFMERYPSIRLELDVSPRRVDLLGEGFDLAIRAGDLQDDAYLIARRITLLTIGLYAAPSYLSKYGWPAHPDQLSQHKTLCVLSQRGEPDKWVLTRSGAGVSEKWQAVPTAAVHVNSPELLGQLTSQGLGIAVMPDRYAQFYLNSGALIRVLPEWSAPTITVWAMTPGRKLMPVKTRVFLEMIDAAILEADCAAMHG